MNHKLSWLALGLLVAAAACSKGNARADSALGTDLSLAAQQSRTLDSLSAVERNGAGPNASRSSAPVRTSTTHRATSSGGAASQGSSAGTTTSGGTVVKHTQRDAAIGAAAGAIIGATTSGNKVKGGLIGAAVGGIVGGVIGNNVDKTKKKP